MTPERWREITAAFHAVRTGAPSERSAALDEACHGDASLRREVEALLAADRDASGRGTTAVSVDDLPRLSPGTVFGAYRIDGVIGAGGMGQVYRATDTRLGRAVALKLVLPDLALDPDVTARFEREAKLLAALNHPNIAAIYEVESVDGIQALVLEFVEGPSLAARCPMPVAEALAVALQIAAALEAAHARGIVHRDLKPGNIKIGPGNRVKVLDFGIAHATSDARATMATQSAAPGTRPGLVIGTPAYMSPEQARGLPVDARTDIWAFGCVLFEMLTGRGPFAGDTASDSLARVIEREPDWSRLPADTPPAIARLLRRCLRKDPDERLHHIADARIEIADAIADPSSVATPAVHTSASSVRAWAWPIAAALAIVVGVLEWRGTGPQPLQTSSASATEFGITFPNNFLPAGGLAVSPDGRQIAANLFSNTGDIWVQTLDGSPPHPLPGGEGGFKPFWSPDGSTIGFFQLAQLVTVKATGGPPARIAAYDAGTWDEVGGGAWNRSDAWNRSGVILYAVKNKLYQVAAAGGGAPVEVSLTGLAGLPVEPHFLPDGRHFVFCDQHGETGSIDLASLAGGAVEVLGPSECPGGFAPPDHVFFLRSGSLVAQRLDLQRLTLTGEPAIVASGVTRGALGPWPVLTATASDTGVLAFPASRGGSFGHLAWFTRDGRPLGSIDPPNDEAEYLNPEISPDSRFVAANFIDPRTGAWHVWLIDPSRRNAASRLTTDVASDYDPVWSSDGSEVLYTSNRGGRFALYRQRVAGGAPVLVRTVGPDQPIATDWSPDGRIVYSLLQQSVWTITLGDQRDPVRVSDESSHANGGRLSPDGKWLVYAEAAPTENHFDVYVKHFPDGSLRRQISAGAGGVHPRWTTTNRGLEVVYWVPPGGIVSTAVSLSDHGVEIGQTRTLVDQPVLSLIDARSHYDVSRDGQRLLVRQPDGPQRPGLRVIVNWLSKLPR